MKIKKYYFIILIICSLFTYSFAKNYNFFEKRENGITYPATFLKGVASSNYQNSGHHYWPSLGYRPESNWTWFEQDFKARYLIDREREGGSSLFFPHSSPINRGERVGISADTWTHMFDDIQLIKELGCNAYRFELPWTDLNPQEGVWNEEAFELFDRYIDALLKNNIEPIITLYHWVHPSWFHNKGAWEKEENSAYFVAYAQEAFKRFGHKVRYWCTINEPTVIAVCGYVIGSHAPGKKDSALMLRPFCKNILLSGFSQHYEVAGTVLAHLFKAHLNVYETLKAMPHGQDAQISIIHQASHFKPLYKAGIAQFVNPISRRLANYFNKIFAHNVFMQFFTTGHFNYVCPNGKVVEFFDTRATSSLDFIGLNFYADMYFSPGPACKKGEKQTDMPMWALRPDSLYKAIKEMSCLNVPIIITENGICDAQDIHRAEWIMSYNNAVKQALDDGYDVRGYCYWSLLDNYEWNMGHNKKFGLYAVDTLSDDPTKKERVLREGSKAYRDYVRVALDQ